MNVIESPFHTNICSVKEKNNFSDKAVTSFGEACIHKCNKYLHKLSLDEVEVVHT